MYNFTSGLQAHDLVSEPVKFLQHLALVFLELILKGCLRSYSKYCCHHHSILMEVMYRGQFFIEKLYICLKRLVGSLLNAGQGT